MRNHLTSLFLSFVNGSSPIPDQIRLTLEGESAKWFRGVWISGIVVALGCCLEVWEITFDLRNWRRHRKGAELLRDNPGSWKYPLAALGLFLVVGGIVGETVFEVLASNADAAIRSHESDVISAADTSAATANGKAVDAEGRLGPLEKEAAQLNKDAEGERLARVQVEAGIAWRRLTDKQKIDIGKRLRDHHVSQVTSVWFLSGDAEGSNFAADIAEMLRDANLQVLPPRPMGPQMQGQRVTTADRIDRWMTGVEVESTTDEASISLADAVVEELNAAGFDAQKFGTSDAPVALAKDIGPNVIVSIAPRPKGPQGEYKLQAEREVKQNKKSKMQ